MVYGTRKEPDSSHAKAQAKERGKERCRSQVYSPQQDLARGTHRSQSGGEMLAKLSGKPHTPNCHRGEMLANFPRSL